MYKRKTSAKKAVFKTFVFVLVIFILYISLASTLPYVKEKKVKDTEKTDISSFTGKSAKEERVKIIDDSYEALIWRLSLINSAKSEIFLSSFEFYGDESGKDILSALYDALNRGVKVTLLIDGYSEAKIKNSEYLKELSLSDNASIYFYNPFSILRPFRAQARMHEKCLIIDRKLYISGGRNTTDKFLGSYSENVNRDRDVLVYTEEPDENSSVTVLCSYFDTLLSQDYCVRFTYSGKSFEETVKNRFTDVKLNYPEAFIPFDISAETFAVNKISVISGSTEPESKEPLVWDALCRLMESGNDITVVSPYIMCGNDMYDDLSGLCDGRNVRLIINSPYTGSNPFGNADYLNCREKVLGTGISLFEYGGEKASHIKTILIDDRISIIGSFNFDMRSAYINSEIMLVIDSTELCSSLKIETEEDLSFCRKVLSDGKFEEGGFYETPKQSVSDKIKTFLMRTTVRMIRYLI